MTSIVLTENTRANNFAVLIIDVIIESSLAVSRVELFAKLLLRCLRFFLGLSDSAVVAAALIHSSLTNSECWVLQALICISRARSQSFVHKISAQA